LLRGRADRTVRTRPAVTTTAVSNGDCQLRITFSGTGADNTLQSLRVGALTNARIDIQGGPVGVQPGLTVPLNGSSSTVLLVSRLAPGGVTVPHTVIDACGDWQTFVGGGAGAF
jgi:hypothetical protein